MPPDDRLHVPATPSGDAIVLTHGAGAGADTPLLVGLAEQFAAGGMLALRYELPFRQARRTGPPSPATADADRAGLREIIAAVRTRAPGRVFLGGHSYGGRQASMVAADDPALVEALLLLSYPLHPPRRPREQRTAHFPALRTPALFVQGSRDPFGSLEELQTALGLVPVITKLVAIEGAPHALLGRRRGRGGEDVVIEIVQSFGAFVDQAARRR
jgi:predicted alpha/beta-hydrolase family hydrolase